MAQRKSSSWSRCCVIILLMMLAERRPGVSATTSSTTAASTTTATAASTSSSSPVTTSTPVSTSTATAASTTTATSVAVSSTAPATAQSATTAISTASAQNTASPVTSNGNCKYGSSVMQPGTSMQVAGCKTVSCSSGGQLQTTSNCNSYQQCLNNVCKVKLMIRIKCRKALASRVNRQLKNACLHDSAFKDANKQRCRKPLMQKTCKELGVSNNKFSF